MAGTIAAVANGKGVVGVNRNGQLNLHIVRVFNDGGYWAWTSTLIAAVSTTGERLVFHYLLILKSRQNHAHNSYQTASVTNHYYLGRSMCRRRSEYREHEPWWRRCKRD